MTDWMVTGGPDVFAKTRELGFTQHGFKSTRRIMANSIGPGDRLAFYVTGRKQFAAIVEVTSAVTESHERIWWNDKKPNELYPYRVTIEPIVALEDEDWLDAEPYHDRFTWTQKWPRTSWALAYQGNLRQVPAEDFELLLADMKKAAVRKPTSAR
ncbi:MAG: EVE domain-containing protein [Dehalococcoidia bacterium]|nr:EVE domain-containing protein [Dehalococcoidia bacterium]MCB9485065.1 EVE domain-containing protein [Thermoflexaceae bacterium]